MQLRKSARVIPDFKNLLKVILKNSEMLQHRAWPQPPALSPGKFQLKVNWTGRGLRQAALRPISDSPVERRATRITDSQIGGLK